MEERGSKADHDGTTDTVQHQSRGKALMQRIDTVSRTCAPRGPIGKILVPSTTARNGENRNVCASDRSSTSNRFRRLDVWGVVSEVAYLLDWRPADKKLLSLKKNSRDSSVELPCVIHHRLGQLFASGVAVFLVLSKNSAVLRV